MQAHAGRMETRPIKGTAERGKSEAEDKAIAATLQASEKNRAENVMIVDLLRNDLAKTCLDHSIKVPDLCRLENFSNVHHLVSTICGHLAETKHRSMHCAKLFPAGRLPAHRKFGPCSILQVWRIAAAGRAMARLGGWALTGAWTPISSFVPPSSKTANAAFTSAAALSPTATRIANEETLNKAASLMAALGMSRAQIASDGEVA